MRVYVIDSGFDKTNPDVPHNKLTYIYCLGCITRPNDDDKAGGGSCLVSKIGGKWFGVFPNGPAFTIVKIAPTLSSFFDALGNVIRDIKSKPYLTGRAVVHISGHWPAEEISRDAINLLQQGIQAVLNLKVMIVTHTVSAPGSGFCYSKGTTVRPYTGSGLAGAVMTGLVAYFLAIPDLHRYFMAQPNFELAVKQYVIAMSYPRNGHVSAVWNGLDARDTRTVYNEPVGDTWIGLPYTGNPRFQ